MEVGSEQVGTAGGRRNASQRLMAALRFRQLELLSTLADTGNMRAAAQRLHMTTAAVSKGLKDVEALFQQTLFHRLPRGVVPTAAGALVVQRGRVLLAEMEQLSDELASPLRPLHERLKIGATPFLAWTLLPGVLADLAGAGQLPGLLLIEGRLADISRQLEAGEVDALITMDTPSELGSLSKQGFTIERIGLEQWRVVCSPRHPLAARNTRKSAPLKWVDVAQEHWILPPRPTHSRMMLERALEDHALPALIPFIETMNAVTHLQLAEQNLGLTLAAQGTLADRLQRGVLVELTMENLPPPVAIVMVYRRSGNYRARLAGLAAAAQRASNVPTAVPGMPSASSRKLSARKSRA
ncbi:LysR family transcriptional regulator [Pseudorhodoferax sp. Leaf274]|uniref:LysR family transcriptional regulator n=1 Tax=Pseudorhodoferax sp. Leaf274 TaxID=1736318 RepID=UPI0009E70C74